MLRTWYKFLIIYGIMVALNGLLPFVSPDERRLLTHTRSGNSVLSTILSDPTATLGAVFFFFGIPLVIALLLYLSYSLLYGNNAHKPTITKYGVSGLILLLVGAYFILLTQAGSLIIAISMCLFTACLG